MRHFAAQNWLGVLKFLTRGREVFIPHVVERELLDAAAVVPAVNAVLDAEWITVFRSHDIAYHRTFAVPFGRGGFRAHVLEHGLLDYGDL